MTHRKTTGRVTLSEQVATQLASMITAGRWQPGEKLPGELELCRILGIGRSTLREALRSLAFVGLVQTSHGEGTFVSGGAEHLLERLLAKGLLRTEKAIADVCEARIVLETELAALCAERIREDEIKVLRGLIARMGQCLDRNTTEFNELDLQFHLEIASFSKNPVLEKVMNPIRDLVSEWIVKSQELPGLRVNAHRQHQAILEALANRKPDRARKAMREHLRTFLRAVALLEKVSALGAVKL